MPCVESCGVMDALRVRALWFALCLAVSLSPCVAFAQPASDGVFVLDDLVARWGQGQVSNALNAPTVRVVASGGVEKRGGMLHPTARPARNQFSLRLPAVNPGDLLALTAWAGVDDLARRDDPLGSCPCMCPTCSPCPTRWKRTYMRTRSRATLL